MVEKIKRLIKVIHPIAISMFLVVATAVLTRAQMEKENFEQWERQRIEERLARLEARTVEIASQTNENSNRLDRIDRMEVPAVLAEINTTIRYDHVLMWFVAVSSAVLILERLGQILGVRRSRNLPQVDAD